MPNKVAEVVANRRASKIGAGGQPTGPRVGPRVIGHEGPGKRGIAKTHCKAHTGGGRGAPNCCWSCANRGETEALPIFYWAP